MSCTTRRYAPALVLLACLLAGCWPLFEQPPLEDGLYLEYDIAGSPLRLTFAKAGGGDFTATLTAGDAPAGQPVTVDRSLKKKTGAPYGPDMLGPVWIPPSSVTKGGNAHGDTVDEVRQWQGWQVGVVRAGFGRGAVRGEWYYEKNTGFLVGGKHATIINEAGTPFVLTGTNLPGLAGALPPRQ